MRIVSLLAPALALTLAACGPMSVQQAERECLNRAQLAEKPRGQIRVGGSSTGKATGGLSLEVSSDYILGRDPSAIFETCVMSKSGEAPTRPLYDRPDWKG